MILKFLTNNKVPLLLVFLLLFTALVVFMTRQDEQILPEVHQKSKTPKEVTQVEQMPKVVEKNTTQTPPVKTLILEDTATYTKPQSEVEQILLEHEKLKEFEKQNNPALKKVGKKEAWEVDYDIGLEDGAVDEMKSKGTLKPKMVNGKVEFSKSF